MKKITIISLHLGFGGIEKYISNLCKMLESDYIINIICVYKFDDVPAFNFSNKINIKYLVKGNPKGKSLKKYLLSFKFLSFIKEILNRINLFINSNRFLIKELKNLSTDYVITTRIKHHRLVNKYVGSYIIKIATEHNYHMNNKKYINGLINSINKFNYLIVPTNELYKSYKDITNVKCIHIPNQIDNIPKVKSKLNNKNIISVGRFSEEKGYLDLIDVFKIINDKDKTIKLYLLGDGHLNNKIRSKVNELNLNDYIIMPGFISSSDHSKYYLDSSLYVMTSFTEAFGLVLIEAMSYGVPCIAFDSASGAKEILDNMGILITNRNKENMAKEILRLLNNKEELNKLQDKIDISNYEEKIVKSKWIEVLVD